MKTKLIRCSDIELITQQDCYKALISGLVLKSKLKDVTCKLVTGFLRSSDELVSYSFKDPQNWEAYEEKHVEWFEDIPEQGVLCWVGDSPKSTFITLVVSMSENNYFITKSNCYYNYAIPLTKEEVEKYIYA